jgi:DNA-binding transcriptional ArsR family regulator
VSAPSPRCFRSNIDWRALHDLGFSLMPVRAGEKTPATQWAQFQGRRATLDEISDWQRAGHNAGIVTGQISGIVVLDLDSETALTEAARRGFPETLAVSTARGRHLYFRHPGIPVRNKVKIFAGADVRGDGGFVVAAGSVHETGARYVWLTEPAWTEIAPAPEWLLEKLRNRPEIEPQSAASMYATPYGQSALDRELTILRNTQEGSRNDQLNRSAHALAQLVAGGQIDTAETKSALHYAALSIGLEADEIARTLESGWRTGSLAPRMPKQANDEPSPHANIFTARALSEMIFAPLRWAIPRLLPEGLALLAGRPKFGKSLLSLQMAVAVATGEGRAFGAPEIQAGDVLVCALEDSRRRLKERLARMYPFGGAPERLHFATAWPRIGQGCIEALDAWCDEHPEARLVVLDTWRAVKPPAGRGPSYDEDATAAAPLLEFAKRRPGLAIVVVHHVRKTEADDVFDTISGTHGLTGIFDTLMVLARHGTGAKLAAQGRDLDGYEKALERDRRTGGWIVNGEVIPLAKTGERQELLDLLAKAEGPLSLSEIAEAVGKKSDAVRHLLKPLVEEGSILQPSHGRYSLVPSQFTQDTQFGGEEHPF